MRVYNQPQQQGFQGPPEPPKIDDNEYIWFWIKRIGKMMLVCTMIIIPACYGTNTFDQIYNRYQARQNAQNQVQLNAIEISQQSQRIQVVKQQAEQRVQEAIGIAEAQKIINKSLTPTYLQHEAIQAQLEAAKNSSHTETIYIPATLQGMPVVPTVNTH